MSFDDVLHGVSFEKIINYLVDGMESLQYWRYTSAAAATVYVYDIFLTFDAEVSSSFLWPA
jgi:hypothetical protein